MPQLDIVTFFKQYIWTLIVLFFLLTLLLTVILPLIKRGSKIRLIFFPSKIETMGANAPLIRKFAQL
uniref:ATP synthase F0 subunit 8 n=1 Tax=Plakortis angulospiculatus TaxID=295227 RepID=B0F962_9METZ|nr:ATP synthase F0 subunit 8 [Plakinastrella cf. onkodes DVL-2011]ABW83963.1 ATP synthase F0 subunit 8 [Plakinastrella cf. onkodes DVL-2011]